MTGDGDGARRRRPTNTQQGSKQAVRLEVSLRVGDAEAELVGDGGGDVIGEVVELPLHVRQVRRRRHRGRLGLRLAAGAACEEEQQQQREDDGDDDAH